MLFKLIARHRDSALAAENSRLSEAVVEARGDSTRHARSLVRAIRRADNAEQALEAFRADIRDAHAALVAENEKLRAAADRKALAK
jgi:hypothetical protein